AGVLVLPAFGGGDRDVADATAAREGARLRVLAQVADDDDLVHGCHGNSSKGSIIGPAPDQPASASSASTSSAVLRGWGARMGQAATSHTSIRTAPVPNSPAGPTFFDSQ